MKLLNLGCGEHCHPEWINVDLSRSAAGVIQADLRRGIPFADDEFDAVYHSHVLEHLTPQEGRKLVEECHRVLKPTGLLRIAVPDLEGIAREYLSSLNQAAKNDPDAVERHRWMTLELLDQMVRARAGGEIGNWIKVPDPVACDFVRGRMGAEYDKIRGELPKPRRPWSLWKVLRAESSRLGRQLAAALLTATTGPRGVTAYKEGLFRQSGEVHRWMYDRVSLGQLLRESGFEQARVCAASESRIKDFGFYELDVVGGDIRKPDSLFMEAAKPVHCAKQAA